MSFFHFCLGYTTHYLPVQPRRGDGHPAVWKFSFSARKKPETCSPPTGFHVGMRPSSVHEYMSCLCFRGLVSGYQTWLRVCLMEMLCRKRPCGSLEYVYIRNGILVSSPSSNGLLYFGGRPVSANKQVSWADSWGPLSWMDFVRLPPGQARA